MQQEKKKHSWGSDTNSEIEDLDMTEFPDVQWNFTPRNPSPEPPHQLADVHYTSGFLYSRIKDVNLHLAEKSVDFVVYNSERESFATMPKIIDKNASQIAISNAKPGHSAIYKFSLTISKDEFIRAILIGETTHAFFHGVFDGVSVVRRYDSPGKITMQISNSIKNYMNDYFIKNNSNLTFVYGYNEFFNKNDLLELQRLVYFAENSNENYAYNGVKEFQITELIDNHGKKIKQKYRANNPSRASRENNDRQVSYSENNPQRASRENNEHQVSHSENNKNLSHNNENNFSHKIVPFGNTPFVLPMYATPQSIGADVFITHFIKETAGVQYYGTGYGVCPTPGTYFTLFPRSSLSKKGFLLANSVGLIDPDYQGELIVSLVRHDGKSEQITDFPCAVAQLVTNSVNCPNFVVIEKFETGTERGAGGFGSTTRVAACRDQGSALDPFRG